MPKRFRICISLRRWILLINAVIADNARKSIRDDLALDDSQTVRNHRLICVP